MSRLAAPLEEASARAAAHPLTNVPGLHAGRTDVSFAQNTERYGGNGLAATHQDQAVLEQGQTLLREMEDKVAQAGALLLCTT